MSISERMPTWDGNVGKEWAIRRNYGRCLDTDGVRASKLDQMISFLRPTSDFDGWRFLYFSLNQKTKKKICEQVITLYGKWAQTYAVLYVMKEIRKVFGARRRVARRTSRWNQWPYLHIVSLGWFSFLRHSRYSNWQNLNFVLYQSRWHNVAHTTKRERKKTKFDQIR